MSVWLPFSVKFRRGHPIVFSVPEVAVWAVAYIRMQEMP